VFPLSLRLSLLPLAVAAALLAGCGSQASKGATSTPSTSNPATQPTQPVPPTPVVTGGSVAAVVNGHAIPMSTYRLMLALTQRNASQTAGSTTAAVAQQAMNEIIVDELVREYAAKHHITASQAEVDARIKADIQRAGSKQAFQRELATYGLSENTYRATLLTTSILGQKVVQQVAPQSAKPEPVAQVRHILIATHPQGKKARTDAQAKALAEQVLARVQHGGNFAALARQYSDDPGSASQGGNLGTVYPHQMVPEFDKASFSLPLHHPALVHSMYGYHIVEVLSRGKATPPAQQQQQAQQQAFGAWLNVQMKRASIKRLARVKGA
jgi:parvulin-like peptidyl-prolyl isomerase